MQDGVTHSQCLSIHHETDRKIGLAFDKISGRVPWTLFVIIMVTVFGSFCTLGYSSFKWNDTAQAAVANASQERSTQIGELKGEIKLLTYQVQVLTEAMKAMNATLRSDVGSGLSKLDTRRGGEQ